MYNIHIDLDNPHNYILPNDDIFKKCIKAVIIEKNINNISVNINIANLEEIQQINNDYRNKNKPTNIISFPFEKPAGLPDDFTEMNDFIGDIVISSDVLEQEAKEQNKHLENHWCHIIIHGVLHLLGYDHIEENEAQEMESLEIKILQSLNISNPYE